MNELNNVPKSAEELDQFFNVSLDLLCLANTDAYFLRLNQAWEKILGYTRDELMSKQFTEFIHPDDVRATQGAVASLSSQKAVTCFANRYIADLDWPYLERKAANDTLKELRDMKGRVRT